LSDSTKLAHSLIRQLIESGVSDFVISPGSRNAPLTIALSEAANKNLIDLHVKIDERGAAFFALGISKASNNYVAVICTSGTAAANFLPAALEAVHSGNKLLVITADRPARLRKTGANQTTDQVGIFKQIKTHDISTDTDIKVYLTGDPIHLNIKFDEPLISSDKSDWLAGIKISPINFRNNIKGKLEVSTGVLIIGHDRGGFTKNEIDVFADKLKWPIIAEDPISFPNSIPHASIFLSDQKIAEYLRPDQVISIGRTTLSRSVNSFISSIKKSIVIDPRTKNVDISREADLVLSSLPDEVKSIETSSETWLAVADSAAKELGNLTWSEQQAIISICDQIVDKSAVFIGSSRPVRDIEAFVHPRGGVEVFANRGLAGIDGNISTVFGIAEKFDSTTAILGDLTFLHDISALTNSSKSNIRIFVIDNNGGGIFSTLPQSNADNFEQVFGTPHNLDLIKVINGFGIPAAKASNLDQLNKLILEPIKGFNVVVVSVPSREENASNLKELIQRVSRAVRIGINLA
jgi:2-succinyl-5-enolpyruvyl-6-hydroxy-3-cyclohexene-1-carboxylate synthase